MQLIFQGSHSVHHSSNIVLIGFMGSGKSSVGRLLAARLGWPFLDTDTQVIAAAGAEIPDIFAQHGEAHFRDLETAALEKLRTAQKTIVATGGGAVLRSENRGLLRELGFVVWLTASEETLFERVSRNAKRPLLQTADPRATVRAMLASRHADYLATAHFTVHTDGLSHMRAADAVLAEAARFFAWAPKV